MNHKQNNLQLKPTCESKKEQTEENKKERYVNEKGNK